MNMYTREIADMLKISLDAALQIQDYLERSCFDFSESSNAKLKREAKLAKTELGI